MGILSTGYNKILNGMTIALVMGIMSFTSVNASNGVWTQVNGANATINITQDGNNNKVGASGQTFAVNGTSNVLVIIQQGQYNNVGSVINMDGLSAADMIVANDVGKNNVFGSDYNEVMIIDDTGKEKKIKRAKKRVVAEKIVNEITKRI